MTTFTIEVVTTIDVSAENAEEAENIGYDWNPRHPQDPGGMYPQQTVSADLVRVLDESEFINRAIERAIKETNDE